jgi:hypothetical protein
MFGCMGSREYTMILHHRINSWITGRWWWMVWPDQVCQICNVFQISIIQKLRWLSVSSWASCCISKYFSANEKGLTLEIYGASPFSEKQEIVLIWVSFNELLPCILSLPGTRQLHGYTCPVVQINQCAIGRSVSWHNIYRDWYLYNSWIFFRISGTKNKILHWWVDVCIMHLSSL